MTTKPHSSEARQRAEEMLNDDAIMVPIVEATALARDVLALEDEVQTLRRMCDAEQELADATYVEVQELRKALDEIASKPYRAEEVIARLQARKDISDA